jgi:hypothetical protein
MSYFCDFHDPYLHLTPEQYAALTEENGLRVRQVNTKSNAWDFQSREAFFAFGSVTFVEWTRRLPESERPAFITDVLDRYRAVAASQPGEENTFKFYQMDIRLARTDAEVLENFLRRLRPESRQRRIRCQADRFSTEA